MAQRSAERRLKAVDDLEALARLAAAILSACRWAALAQLGYAPALPIGPLAAHVAARVVRNDGVKLPKHGRIGGSIRPPGMGTPAPAPSAWVPSARFTAAPKAAAARNSERTT